MTKSNGRLTAVAPILIGAALTISPVFAQSTATENAAPARVIAAPTDYYQSVAADVVRKINASRQARETQQDAAIVTAQNSTTDPAIKTPAASDQETTANAVRAITAALQPAAPKQDAEPVTQEIELVSADGLVSLEGIIQDFDDALITIEASFGVISVERVGLECIGAACPDELRGASDPAAQDADVNAPAN